MKRNVFKNLVIATFFTISTDFTFAAEIVGSDLELADGKALATTSMSPSDVDSFFVTAGFESVVGKLSSSGGKSRMLEGLEILKKQQHEALCEINALHAEVAALRCFAPPPSPPPSPPSEKLSDHVRQAMLGEGIPLLSLGAFEDFFGSTSSRQLPEVANLKVVPKPARVFVDSSLSQIEQEQLDACWDAFISSSVGRHIAEKGDGELRFGSVTGMRASDLLANKPFRRTDVEALIREATDYYDVNKALPRAIQEVRQLRRHLATASISPSDVDTLLHTAGFGTIVRKLSSTHGKGRIIEALKKIEEQQDALEEDAFATHRLRAENEQLKKIIAGMKSSSVS